MALNQVSFLKNQADLNILGHIFQNSLNEIESINTETEGGNFDKQKSKRIKDGVFYTPKYIIKNNFENIAGKLLREMKSKLEEKFFKGLKRRQDCCLQS